MTSSAQAAAMISAAAKKSTATAAAADTTTEAPVPKKGAKIKLPGNKVKPVQPTAVHMGDSVDGGAVQVPIEENVLHTAEPAVTHSIASTEVVTGTLDKGQGDTTAAMVIAHDPTTGEWKPVDKIGTEQAKAIVEVTHPDGTVEHAEEAVGKPKHFTQPNCTVGFGAKYRKNMGNYESAEVSVFLSVPAAHGEINKVYDFAVSWVDERMNTALGQLDNAKG